MKTDSSHKKSVWTDYFANKSIFMRLMKWAQMKFLVPKFMKEIDPYIKAGSKVLEAGCGTAMNTLYACSLINAEPWGLDISEVALNQARRTAIQIGISINLVLGDIQNMPFSQRSFDMVWNQGVLEHFNNPVETMTEMARVGKRVFIAVPRRTFLRNFVQKVKTFLGLTAEDIFYLYTEAELINLISQVNGVSSIASGSFNCLHLFSWTWVCGITDGESISHKTKEQNYFFENRSNDWSILCKKETE